jgi:short-subunit dehydrogenase
MPVSSEEPFPSPRPSRLRAQYGPTAFVTGASDGIGRAFAEQLAADGLDLVLLGRREPHLEALAAELRSRHGVRCAVVAADLSSDDGIAAACAAADAHDVGLLVAAAGFGTSGPFISSDLDSELAMIDVNCRAVVALCHRVGQRMAIRRRGGLVLMSSIVAFQGVARTANYAATKAFVQTFAEGLGRELAPHGVAVLAVAPGPVRSGFERRAGMTMGQAEMPATVAAGALRALGRRRTVRPGWRSRLLGLSLATLPRSFRTRILSGIMANMTGRRNDRTEKSTRSA